MNSNSGNSSSSLTTCERVKRYIDGVYPHVVYREGYFEVRGRIVEMISIQNIHWRYAGLFTELCDESYDGSWEKFKAFKNGKCILLITKVFEIIKKRKSICIARNWEN